MNYPLISEYVDAIKYAEDNFASLSYLRPVMNDDGMPVMTSGNFAVVFKMKDEQTGKLYAVKCFTKEQEGREEAYRLIDDELKRVDSPYLTSICYLDKELFVDTGQSTETEFPVLLMDWVEGKTLDKYLRENLDDKYALEMLAYRFSQLAQWLIPQPFAHGDLKPDNILVKDDGTLVLVDYDGMYVPAMKGQKARELGSPDFRHPQRTDDDFDEHIDDFASVSILLSLKAISIKPLLLDEYGASDRLLFSQEDYQDIQLSRSISAILCLIHDISILNVYTTFLYVFSQKVILLDNISSLEIEVSPDVIYDYAKSLSNQGDEKPAFVKWLFLASNGYAKAQNAIGVCYLKGYGVEQNKAEAINWFELAASQDYVSSIFNLGTCYRSGYGVEKDEHKAFQLYKHASKLKSEEAYYQMSLCYLKGFGVEENDSKALIWLKKAANKRFPKALFKLAGFYETGFLVDKDERKAILLYQKAANKGYKKALKKLGEIYRLGNCGLQVSYKKSFTYYFKAANLGDASSQFYIGYYYASGLGVKQDYQKAVEWYTRSSEQGHASALNNLAVCYEHGKGVEIDLIHALTLFKQAAMLGSAKAQTALNALRCDTEKQRALSELYLKSKYYDKELAFFWSLSAAEQYDIKSQERVAQFYYLGFGIQKSYDNSLIWFAKSQNGGDVNKEIKCVEDAFSFVKENAEHEDSYSQYIIGKCFEKGIFVEKSPESAINWFKKAADQGLPNAFFKLRFFKVLNNKSSLVQDAINYENWISNESNLKNDYSISRILNYLNCIKVARGKTLKLHVAYREPSDNSWLYVEDEYDKGKEIWKNLEVKESDKGFWQICLLKSSIYVMPPYDHGAYISRKYIYSEKELLSYLSVNATDHYSELKVAVKGLFLAPYIGVNGNVGIVSRCYWNYWEGLIREFVLIISENNKVIYIKNISNRTLCPGFYDVML